MRSGILLFWLAEVGKETKVGLVNEDSIMSELKRISYTDDEPDIRAIAQIALEDIGGFEMQMCSGGQETVERVPVFQPDLILLDMMMPGMDGVQTFKALKAMPEIADIPIIFMTAKVQSHEVASYMELGAAGVIPKPFDAITLAQDLQEIWQRHPARRVA